MILCNLITYLENLDPATVVPIGFGNPQSYRGYYEDLAFEPVHNTTIGDMLAAAKSALGCTFTGYKGGEYTMQDYTDCWLANYGECGEGIGPVLLGYMTGDDRQGALPCVTITSPPPLEQAQARIVELERELDAANAGHLDTIIERDALKQENQLLRAENVNLSMAHGPGNHTDWMLTRASKYEQLHKDLEKIRQERDALRLFPARLSGVMRRFKFVTCFEDDAETVEANLISILKKFDEVVAERDTRRAVVEKADALVSAIILVPNFMEVVSGIVQDVWQRYHVNDSGLPFNPDIVADEMRTAIAAYQEARHAG